MAMRKSIALAIQISICIALFIADFYYPNYYLEKGFFTFLALTAIYVVFKIAIEESAVRKIKDPMTKYSARKVISIIYILIFVGTVVAIWFGDSQALFVSYGIIGAGIAIALQDFFRNFVGGILLFFSGMYRTGDRIELDSHYGDVIDIGLFYTTLLEIQNWVDGDQATGRLTIIPNSKVLSTAIQNYTKDHSFIWDEILIPLTYDSDWKTAREIILKIVKEETKNTKVQAEKEMASIMQKYYLTGRPVDPAIFITLTDNWIDLHVRYITGVRDRRATRTSIYEKILLGFESSKNIRIASESLIISGFPDIKMDKK